MTGISGCLFFQLFLRAEVIWCCHVEFKVCARPLYLVVSCFVSNLFCFCHLTLWGIITTKQNVGLHFFKAARETEIADFHLRGQEESPQSMPLKQCLSFRLLLTQKNNL